MTKEIFYIEAYDKCTIDELSRALSIHKITVFSSWHRFGEKVTSGYSIQISKEDLSLLVLSVGPLVVRKLEN